MSKSTASISLEGMGKRYVIGTREARYETLRDTLVAGVKGVARRLVRPHIGGEVQDFWALRNVSLEIQPGEAVGLIGANGAGKSTMLKILSRITKPTEGRAIINGRVGSLLEVGTGFHPELSGRENIYLNGAILGMKRAEIQRKFDEIVDFAGIELFLDTPVKRYSSGMYVRLAFAVAAHLEPDILVVDEVLSVGDAAFQKRSLGRMGEVSQQGRTVLFVSHNMTSIRSLCKRAIWLDEGQVKADGNVADIVNQYMNPEESLATQTTWLANNRPGNRSFKLVSVKLKDIAGGEVSAVNISEDFLVEIEYEVTQEGSQAGLSVVMFDSEGTAVFSSLSNTEELYYNRPLQVGRYTSTCRVYGNLLNSGRFFATVIGFSSNFSEGFRAERAISFEAVDDGVLRRDYFQGYSGPIRPMLEWKTKPLNLGDADS